MLSFPDSIKSQCRNLRVVMFMLPPGYAIGWNGWKSMK
jgi:hypothetical protein